jgi:hypothetical protein
VKPADLQRFFNHVSGYYFNSFSRATEDATAASTPTIGSNAPVSQYKLYKSHRTATSVSSKWFGTLHFDASNSAKCFPGGIDELEQKHKNQWQNHLSIVQAKSFSRVKLIMANI